MNLVVLGLSVTSSWGNGHATTYRGLLREFARRGHDVLFLERDCPWYAQNRDLPCSPDYRIALYESAFDLQERFGGEIADADAVLIGSYVPDGAQIGEWLISAADGPIVFYDIDTPVTVDAIASGSCSYLNRDLAGAYDLYLSFTGGPLLERIQREYHIPRVAPLYCSADLQNYFPEPAEHEWDLGYLGTYSPDRQPTLEELLLFPARALSDRRFVVAGPQYPADTSWPQNVLRIEHLGPAEHRRFYARQRFTLNITRAAMVAAGYSPSIRLFEASACGTPVISDPWAGIETFFTPGEEILLAGNHEEALELLRSVTPAESIEIGRRARERVLREHTAAHRAAELERHLQSLSVSKEEEALP